MTVFLIAYKSLYSSFLDISHDSLLDKFQDYQKQEKGMH